MGCLYQSPPPRLREEEEGLGESEGMHELKRTVSPRHNGTETALIGPIQVQTRQSPSTERGRGHKLTPSNQKLCAIGTHWQRGKPVFSSAVSLGISTKCQGSSHAQN